MTNAAQGLGLHAGDVIAGKYRVERVLGQGGMGVVVAAHHLQLDEKVALKFLLPEALSNPEAIGRFLREARAAVKIKSEHVARVIDVGQLDGGSPFMVMEYLDGEDLAGWLARRGRLPTAQAIDFVLQACEAIAEAHALGIVHRDLKPANLFCIVRADGRLSVKVLDFGISKVTTPGAPGNDLTRTTSIVGSPTYMSPEQLQASKGVDVRTDIWSLGVILFELLTGRPPFDAEAVTELVIQIAMNECPSVRGIRADVPPGLEQVILTCLQKDRARRFPSVRELGLALQDFGSAPHARASVERILGTLRGEGPTAMGVPPMRDRASSVPTHLPTAVAPAPRPTNVSWGTEPLPKSNGAAVAGMIAAGFAVVAIGGVVLVRALRPHLPPLPPPAKTMDAGPGEAMDADVIPLLERESDAAADAGVDASDGGTNASDAGVDASDAGHQRHPWPPQPQPQPQPPPQPQPVCKVVQSFGPNGEPHFTKVCP